MSRHLGIAVACALFVAACTQQVTDDTTIETVSSQPPGVETTTSTSSGLAPDGYAICWTNPAPGAGGAIAFEDSTADWGLVEALTGMRGHAAAWGDVNADGLVDLFVGTFATSRPEVYQVRGADGPAPDRLLINLGDRFEVVDGFPERIARTSGAAFVDLDVDGDLDLVASSNENGRVESAPTEILENTADGFVPVESGIDPDIGGRSIGVLDIDGDGLLDLLIVEDRYRGGSSRLYRNTGDLRFEDAGDEWGFPTDVHGLGVATSDLNNDGHADFFVAGSNRLFIGTGSGVEEVSGAIGAWETYGPEDDVSGAAIADVNRDGWLDLVVGHHFNSTVDRGEEVPVRLYLNRTATAGDQPVFDDVTEDASIPLPTKAPHVELADVDNDGWLDVVTSASALDGTGIAVLRGLPAENGIPTFASPEGLGSVQYWVTSPTTDLDRDGRLDLLAIEWEPSLPSVLFHNESQSGHWLEVAVTDRYGGIGARVYVYEGGSAGDPAALLGARDIVVTVGYTAGVEAVAHFGLGNASVVDVVVHPVGNEETITLEAVAADARIDVGGDC